MTKSKKKNTHTVQTQTKNTNRVIMTRMGKYFRKGERVVDFLLHRR